LQRQLMLNHFEEGGYIKSQGIFHIKPNYSSKKRGIIGLF